MSPPPSRAELMERVRLKVKGKSVVLYPAVSEHIERLKDMKRLLSQKRPDEDFVTITHTDLINALRTGVAVHTEQCTDGSGWTVIVNGTSMEGVLLTMSVLLPSNNSDDSPLAIMSFDLPPSEPAITSLETKLR